MAEREWGDGLARQVLVEAIYGDLLKVLPGAFTPELFGEQSARQRIAAVLAAWAEKSAPGARIAPGVLNELITRDMETRTEPEREAIADEWAMIQSTDPSEDPEFVYGEVREWIEYRRTRQALLDAREALDRGGIEDTRDILARIEPVRTKSNENEPTELYYMAGAADRMDAYRAGDVGGRRIPTGMPAFDALTKGGPRVRESWYFLAPPKGGKTTFLLNVGRGAASRGFGVYYNTFEDGADAMMTRLDQMNTRSTLEELTGDAETAGNLTQLQKVIDGMRTSGRGEIITTRRPTGQKGAVRAVAADVKRLRRSGAKIDVVILDYLNLMGSTVNERELRHELFAISYEISDLAKDLDVLVWSATLVRREAVDKVPIRKTDISEAFGVIAALNGAVAICSPPVLVQNNIRRLYMAAARSVQDEALAGDFRVDFSRYSITPYNSQEVDRMLERAVAERLARRRGVQEGNSGG
jgi:hypothetical protein